MICKILFLAAEIFFSGVLVGWMATEQKYRNICLSEKEKEEKEES